MKALGLELSLFKYFSPFSILLTKKKNAASSWILKTYILGHFPQLTKYSKNR